MDRLKRRLAEWTADESGNVMIMYAGALIPLLMMIGGAVDVANFYAARAKLQNACDAAVLAGRQSMEGNAWSDAVEVEADKFFDFNFPAGTNRALSQSFAIEQNETDPAELLGDASAVIPTIVMHIFGFETLTAGVECNAKRDLGHNDVMLVLDTTGSMASAPSIGGDSKIKRLREGAAGIFRALDDSANGSITRFGIVSYSHTVNVARSLVTNDILRSQTYIDGSWDYIYCDSNGHQIWNCQNRNSETKPNSGLSNGNKKYTYNVTFRNEAKTVQAKNSSWPRNGSNSDSIDRFRTSGNGCIEERPSVGNPASPVEIEDTITRADIDTRASSSSDTALQFGRYDPGVQEGMSQVGCPSESQRLTTYGSEDAFTTAIGNATASVTGGTYHDIGILWGLRFLSPTGFFSADNPTSHGIIPVNKHMVFMTDGKLDTGGTLYSAHGVENYQERTQGSGSQTDKHVARFEAACKVAKSMGITVWVIALDVTDTDLVDDCATSAGHFYTSDGSDLEEIFENIGQGIGNLRLTQ